MGNFPGDTDTANSMHNNNMKHPRSNYQQKYSNSSDADKHFPHGDKSNNTSTRPSSANNADSIPIRVVYTNPKNKYTADGRNTTELPIRGSSNLESPLNDTTAGGNSPRLERAHSEPPKTFNQKLKLAGATPGGGGWVVPGTIPENSESFDGQSARINNQQPQHYNLSEPHNNLSTSASAPSVPSHQNRPTTAPPAAPPRRSVPTRVNMNNEQTS